MCLSLSSTTSLGRGAEGNKGLPQEYISGFGSRMYCRVEASSRKFKLFGEWLGLQDVASCPDFDRKKR